MDWNTMPVKHNIYLNIVTYVTVTCLPEPDVGVEYTAYSKGIRYDIFEGLLDIYFYILLLPVTLE